MAVVLHKWNFGYPHASEARERLVNPVPGQKTWKALGRPYSLFFIIDPATMKSYTKKKKLVPKEHTPEPNNGQPVVKFVWAQLGSCNWYGSFCDDSQGSRHISLMIKLDLKDRFSRIYYYASDLKKTSLYIVDFLRDRLSRFHVSVVKFLVSGNPEKNFCQWWTSLGPVRDLIW